MVFLWFLVGFHGFSRWFNGFSWFWLVSMVFQGGGMVFMVFGWFPWFFKVVSRWFHGFWLVSMVFQGGCMVFHGFWLVSIVLLVQNTTNCILAQRSILGLASRRPAFA